MSSMLPQGKGGLSQVAQESESGASKGNALPSVNLPKGGGAIKGIDEKLGVNAVTGTASTSIAFPPVHLDQVAVDRNSH